MNNRFFLVLGFVLLLACSEEDTEEAESTERSKNIKPIVKEEVIRKAPKDNFSEKKMNSESHEYKSKTLTQGKLENTETSKQNLPTRTTKVGKPTNQYTTPASIEPSTSSPKKAQKKDNEKSKVSKPLVEPKAIISKSPDKTVANSSEVNLELPKAKTEDDTITRPKTNSTTSLPQKATRNVPASTMRGFILAAERGEAHIVQKDVNKYWHKLDEREQATLRLIGYKSPDEQ